MGKGIQFTHYCIVRIDDYALTLDSFSIVLNILITSHVQVSDVSNGC